MHAEPQKIPLKELPSARDKSAVILCKLNYYVSGHTRVAARDALRPRLTIPHIIQPSHHHELPTLFATLPMNVVRLLPLGVLLPLVEAVEHHHATVARKQALENPLFRDCLLSGIEHSVMV